MRRLERRCSVIIPTRDRPEVLAETLTRLEELPDRPMETIVVDNGSKASTEALRSRFTWVRWIELGANLSASARNVGAMAARSDILLMLDDDSWPAAGTIDRLMREFEEKPTLGAIACRVRLADVPDRHDAGGVPGTFFNCGAAIRRSAFVEAGGYPIDYDYYVEEYALSCELWRRGWSVESMGAAIVWHRRTEENRDTNRMLRFLVRNNVRLWNTYAPESRRSQSIDSDVERYRRIALKENALAGFDAGLAEAERHTLSVIRRRRPLSDAQFDSLFGLHQLRQLLRERADKRMMRRVAIWLRGKGCEFIVEAAKSAGIRVTCVYDPWLADQRSPAMWRGLPIHDVDTATDIDADGLLVGTLSPGVAEDATLELRNRFNDIDIINPAPWGDSGSARIGDARCCRSHVA
ncbi:MAG: glycosyltransferase [Phycisphaerales bacterium]|nr:glycosyltransferase [Phycisphaerales bacterium]MCB9858636.1 glycosyltransferase [Phycisphaerales bacterium]